MKKCICNCGNEHEIDSELSEIQQKALTRPCPACETGRLHAVPDSDSDEVYLHCNNCYLSMDSDGGYTK